MGGDERSQKGKYGVIALPTLSAVALVALGLFAFQGKIFGSDAGTLTIGEVDDASDNHIVLDESELAREAPALRSALERARQEGSAAINNDDDLKESVEYLRQNSDPDAPDWTVEYKGRMFEIQRHIA